MWSNFLNCQQIAEYFLLTTWPIFIPKIDPNTTYYMIETRECPIYLISHFPDLEKDVVALH